MICKTCGKDIDNTNASCNYCGSDAMTIGTQHNADNSKKEQTTMDLNIYTCPRCGSISVGLKKCNYCDSITCKTGFNIFQLIGNGDFKIVLKTKEQLFEEFARSSSYFSLDKWEEFKLKRKQNLKYYAKISWDRVMKKPIRVCPQCGHISACSAYFNDNICYICNTTYVDSNVKGFKYYHRDEETDDYLENLRNNIRKRYCVHSSLFNESSWNKRIESEKQVPYRLEKKSESDGTSLTALGVIPALIGMPFRIKEGKNRLFLLVSSLLEYVNYYSTQMSFCDQHNLQPSCAQLRELLSDVQNIVRSQVFMGQQEAVDSFNLLLIDLSEQIKRK